MKTLHGIAKTADGCEIPVDYRIVRGKPKILRINPEPGERIVLSEEWIHAHAEPDTRPIIK